MKQTKTGNPLLNNRWLKVVVFLAVLYFTFILRAHNFDRSPPIGHLEELLYAWSGIYLIETGVPVSWSDLDYPDRAEFYKGKVAYQGRPPFVYVTLYRPWLDEPALFSLLVGGFGHLYRADRSDVIPTSYIRTPMVMIATMVSVIIFFLAKLLTGYWSGILAMLIYGITPIMVLSSRMAVPENLIGLFLMLTVLLIYQFLKKDQNFWLYPIPILAGLAGLSKPTGFFILPLAAYFAFTKRKYKISGLMFLAILPFVAIFFWYGLHFDPDIFWRITQIQGARPAGFSSLAYFFTSPAFDISTLLDSWFVFCLLCAFYYIFKPKEDLGELISFSFVYWLIVVMLSGGEHDLLPWYRYPSYPLLAIIGAWGMIEVVKSANFYSSFLAIGFFLGNRFLLVNGLRPNLASNHFRIIYSLLILPSIANSLWDKKWLFRLSKAVIIGVIIVGAFFNTKYIYNHFEFVCEGSPCPFGPGTTLSTLHFPFSKFILLGESELK